MGARYIATAPVGAYVVNRSIGVVGRTRYPNGGGTLRNSFPRTSRKEARKCPGICTTCVLPRPTHPAGSGSVALIPKWGPDLLRFWRGGLAGDPNPTTLRALHGIRGKEFLGILPLISLGWGGRGPYELTL